MPNVSNIIANGHYNYAEDFTNKSITELHIFYNEAAEGDDYICRFEGHLKCLNTSNNKVLNFENVYPSEVSLNDDSRTLTDMIHNNIKKDHQQISFQLSYIIIGSYMMFLILILILTNDLVSNRNIAKITRALKID